MVVSRFSIVVIFFDEDKVTTDDTFSAKQPSLDDVTFEGHELADDLERSLSMEGGSERIIQCDEISSATTHEKADMAIVYSTAGGRNSSGLLTYTQFHLQSALNISSSNIRCKSQYERPMQFSRNISTQVLFSD